MSSKYYGEYQCFACGYMDDDFSYFHVLSGEDDLICVGCYDNYLGECDILVEDTIHD